MLDCHQKIAAYQGRVRREKRPMRVQQCFDPTAPDIRRAVRSKIRRPLAHRLVRMYQRAEAADQAQSYFESAHGRRETPDRMIEEFYGGELRRVSKDTATASIVDFICASGIATTRSAARRLIEQGAVKLDDQPVRPSDTTVDPATAHVLCPERKLKRYRPRPE
jgi:tyrosyl-tRNA synthetase